MFRTVITASKTVQSAVPILLKQTPIGSIGCRKYSIGIYDYLQANKDLMKKIDSGKADGYELRKLLTEMQGADYIPGSEEIENLMNACRKLNDFSLAVRVLEAVKWKCGTDAALYNKLIASVKPTLDKLGIPTVDQIGYEKPEYWYPDADDVHNYDPETGKEL